MDFDFRNMGMDEAYNANGEKVNLKELKERGYKIYADIGCGKETDIFELASNDVFIVLLELDSASHFLKKHLDYARKNGIPNILAKTTVNENLPFGDHLFDRIEVHYVFSIGWVSASSLIASIVRALKNNGLLIISAEFLHNDGKKAEEALFPHILELFKDYVVVGVRLPMSETGRIYRLDNVTYLISRSREVVEREVQRLEEKRKAEIKKYVPNFFVNFDVRWSERFNILPALKELVELWLATSLEKFLARYKIGKKWPGYILVLNPGSIGSSRYTLAIKVLEPGKAVIYFTEGTNIWHEDDTICTITKK